MPRMKPRENPATPSLWYNVMAPRWTKMNALLGGTEGMRSASKAFLPQHEEEDDDTYAERLQMATLLNMTDLTLDSLVGRPFSDPVEIDEGTPDEIETLLEDVDLAGNNLQVFARQWFKEGVAKAFCHVLVEFPRLAEGVERTVADDEREGIRPYWLLVEPENLIAARRAVIDGREIVTHARIVTTETEVDGFAESSRTHIRVMDRVGVLADEADPNSEVLFKVRVQVWREVLDNAGRPKPDEWEVIDEWMVDLDEIPLVTFYAEREDFMLARLPLDDLADLNITHWQSYSDQRMILTMSRFAMLALSGGIPSTGKGQGGSKVKVGPKRLLHTPDANGKFYYVEHAGKGTADGWKDLTMLVEQMAEWGAVFLRKRPGNPTATARALDSAEATSPLQDMTLRFMDAVNRALDFTARWMGLDEGGGVTINSDFGPEDPNGDDLRTLTEARKNRDLSMKRYLDELRRRAVLGDDFDFDANMAELEKEMEDAMERAAQAMTDLDPGQGEEQPDDGDEENPQQETPGPEPAA